MTLANIGLLHPGEMGISVAAALQHNRHRIYWLPQGRSSLTRERANKFGLAPVDSMDVMCRRCELIIAVCPSRAAESVANEVIRCQFQGVYLEANAIAPSLSRRVGELMEQSGIDYVDGCIIGPPMQIPGITKLYLSGERADSVARLFASSAIGPSVLGTEAGQASAIKMCDSLFNKGLLALLYETVSAAEHFGVHNNLISYWEENKGGAANISIAGDRLNYSVRKAWRFVDEMEQVAKTLADCPSLPANFVLDAQTIYSRLEQFRPGGETPSHEAIVAAILESD